MKMAGSQYSGREDNGSIGIANMHANAAAEKLGEKGILRGTSGCIYDDEGQFVMLETVKKAYKALTYEEIAPYTMGPKAYLECCISQCFGQSRPAGIIRAIATPGSTGALHHAICGYTEPGDTVLTSDWHWGSYDNLCRDNGRVLKTFHLLDKTNHFDLESFGKAVKEILVKQEEVTIILNSPANNPTGYSLSDAEWDGVMGILKEAAATGKKIIFVSDVAYIDYSGEKETCRKFFKKFGGLPENVLFLVAYTMSKGFTVYGQRAGSLICVTPSESTAEEFVKTAQCMSKCTWGSCCFAPMNAMMKICSDPAEVKAIDAERAATFAMIRDRAAIFSAEADKVGLKMLPYLCGFFITLPMKGSDKVCAILEKENIFLVPLEDGIRIAICSIPKAKVPGLASAIKTAVEEAGAVQ